MIGFDACLMGSWEVATTVSRFASVLVASPELVPEAGWPIASIAERASSAADVPPYDLASEIAVQFQGASRHHASITGVDLAAVGALDAVIDALAKQALRDACAFCVFRPS